MNYKNKLAMLSFAFMAGCGGQGEVHIVTPEQAAENILNNHSIVAKDGGRWLVKKTPEGTEVKHIMAAGVGGKRTSEFKVAADGTVAAREYEEVLRCKKGKGEYTELFSEFKIGHHPACNYKIKKETKSEEVSVKVIDALARGQLESARQMSACREKHGAHACKMNVL